MDVQRDNSFMEVIRLLDTKPHAVIRAQGYLEFC